MKKRVTVTIDDCERCPHVHENWSSGHPFLYDYLYCTKTNKKLTGVGFRGIPEWCPLEDVKDD